MIRMFEKLIDFLRALTFACFISVCELIVWDAKGLDAYSVGQRKSFWYFAVLYFSSSCSHCHVDLRYLYCLLILSYCSEVVDNYEADKTWVVTAQRSSRNKAHVSASVFCFRRKTKREKLMSHKNDAVISQQEAVSEA